MIEAEEKKLPEEVTKTIAEMEDEDIMTAVNALLNKEYFRNIFCEVIKKDRHIMDVFDDVIYEHEKENKKALQNVLSSKYPGFFKDMTLEEYLSALKMDLSLCGVVLYTLHKLRNNHFLYGEPINLETLNNTIRRASASISCDIPSIRNALAILHNHNIIKCEFDQTLDNCYVAFNFYQFLIPDKVLSHGEILKHVAYLTTADWETLLMSHIDLMEEAHQSYCQCFKHHCLAGLSPSDSYHSLERTKLHISFFFIEFLLENGCTPSALYLAEYLNVSEVSTLYSLLQLCKEWIAPIPQTSLEDALEKKFGECGQFIFNMDKFEEFLSSIHPITDELQANGKCWEWGTLVDAFPNRSLAMARQWMTDEQIEKIREEGKCEGKRADSKEVVKPCYQQQLVWSPQSPANLNTPS